MTAPFRLAKPRTNDSASTANSASSPHTPSFEAPIRIDREKLRQPEARQLLRDQLSHHFPDMKRRPSEDSARNMMLNNRFARRRSSTFDVPAKEVGADNSAQSSSSTVNSINGRKLSAVTEKTVPDIDVEQAILLLQELKKKASPDELVALHRALLPTKDVEQVVSKPSREIDERQKAPPPPPPPVHRRSVLPPGLATRGGPTGDILRKPDESWYEPETVKKSHGKGWVPESESTHQTSRSISSLNALDLAEDNGQHLSRVSTPSEAPYTFAGAYRPGTLRVTNGAASPEPSIVTTIPLGEDEIKPEDGYFTSSEGRVSLDKPSSRASMDVIRAKPSVESLSIRDRILNSDKALQQRKDRAQRLSGISAPSQESLVSRTGLQLNTKVSKVSMDRESVSPMSEGRATPRWMQRQSHRASQLSVEYMQDCVASSSSSMTEERSNALRDFALRLSTVYDSDDDDDEPKQSGTPADALSKLTGQSEAAEVFDEPQPKPAGSRPLPAEPSSNRYRATARPSPPHKVDSGYGSEISLSRRTRRTSIEEQRATPPRAISLKKSADPSLQNVNEQEEQAETGSIDGAQSLYTFQQVLSTPSLLAGLRTPARLSTQSSLPLRTLSVQRSSIDREALSPEPSVPQLSTQSVIQPPPAEPNVSPAESKKRRSSVKQTRKLQKSMPPEVKKQRKEEHRRMKAARVASMALVPSAGETIELPAGHVDFGKLSIPSIPPFDPAPPLEVGEQSFSSVPDSEAIASSPAVSRTRFSLPPEPTASTNPAAAENEVSERRQSTEHTRGRSESIRQTPSTDSIPEAHRAWSIAKLRGKSGSRKRSRTPKRSSLELMHRKAAEAASEHGSARSPTDEAIPPWTDFSSVARTLGAGSYDIATNHVQRASSSLPSATAHQLQSPYLISTGLLPGRSVKGMDSEAASELARMKSRDFAARRDGENTPLDRPRMATPKQDKGKGRPTEDRASEWYSQPSTPDRAQTMHRPHSMYAESIPPLPELPADVEAKSAKVDELVAKKLKDSPNNTARNSGENQLAATRPAMVKRTSQYRAHQEIKIDEEAAMQLLHPIERASLKQSLEVNVQVRELSGSGSELSSSAATPEKEEVAFVQSPTHDAQHPGWPGWEQQAKAWRKRRESIGAALGRAPDEESVLSAEFPPESRKPSAAVAQNINPSVAKSPSIVVSRYITPLTTENRARATAQDRPTDAAAQHANAYRELLETDYDDTETENRPAKQDIPRTDSAFTTTSTTSSTFVTVKSWDPRPAKPDVPRTDSAYSAKSYTTTYTNTTTATTYSRARSPGGHVRTPSGNFIPYTPSKASLAERSRAHSLAKLNGEATASAPSLPTHYPPATPTSSAARPTSSGDWRARNQSTESLCDRYSGGLGYGWDREGGFAGSAGTRSSGGGMDSGTGGTRKSVRVSRELGLDLSDVPVMIQRVG